ncbi:MAG TPA: lipid IV(A) 3-deoxy-D-manno-octulosonic acid transferase [Burkholderiales bacterium]|nr:lipid IV(A) 3-deoxy-D-manno-octulosonic acid transferase [Burkholderiales bacterium]
MSGWRTVYSTLLYLLVPFALLRLAWRGRRQPGYLEHIPERFGLYAVSLPRPVIWLHAVSVGETRAAEPLITALRERWPDHRILMTHMTPTGRETGEQAFGAKVSRCYLPYDLPHAVARFLSHFQPRLGLLLETELWPNLIHACRARSIPLYLVNARLSERSARGYARFEGFARTTLQELEGVAAQTEADAQRLIALGAPKVVVCGNLKFDRSPRPQDLELGKRFRDWFGARPVFLAASTREDEEEKVLAALELAARPGLLTVIVPRHPQRFDAVAKLLTERGLTYQRRTEARPVEASTAVVLGDSMGELYAFYAACDLAFVGGSLLPLGGQNLLEACAVGKPAVVGPYTFNFEEATRLAVDAGAAARVQNERELGRLLAELLTSPERRARMGQAGLALMRKHQGAAGRVVALLKP